MTAPSLNYRSYRTRAISLSSSLAALRSYPFNTRTAAIIAGTHNRFSAATVQSLTTCTAILYHQPQSPNEQVDKRPQSRLFSDGPRSRRQLDPTPKTHVRRTPSGSVHLGSKICADFTDRRTPQTQPFAPSVADFNEKRHSLEPSCANCANPQLLSPYCADRTASSVCFACRK